MNVATLKALAGQTAAAFVQSGMVVGLGSGSTAIHATREIARRLGSGELRDIVGIPTSRATEAAAIELGIPLSTLAHHGRIDLTIDGADEVDPAFDLIKGGGGAHLREKIVAQATERLVIVVDESKLSRQLGTRFALPVEVAIFGWQAQAAYLERLGARVTRRLAGEQAYETDQGNYILDCDFGGMADAAGLARRLEARAGVVEHGLFLGLARDMVVAGAGGVRWLRL